MSKAFNEEMSEIQGLIFSGYAQSPLSSFYLLKFSNPKLAKTWLAKIIPEVSVGESDRQKREAATTQLNVAFSYSGIESFIGANASFEDAFKDGMDSDRRRTILGDLQENNPDNWLWGSKDKKVDILLMLYSKDLTTHHQRQLELESQFAAAGLSEVVSRLDNSVIPGQNGQKFPREHFGFSDGVSQPTIGKPALKHSSENMQSPIPIEVGEFVLGYNNGYDGTKTKVPSLPDRPDFGRNGSYLVFRQLQQDVKGFWSFIEKEASFQGIAPDYLAAKIVGRWKSGALVQPGQSVDPGTNSTKTHNDFDFRDDPNGVGCPLGSHVRRTNPRALGLGESFAESLKVANRHRIIRRGRNYGNFLEHPLQDIDNDADERGLFFICLNANIERQFEFIQHTWVNNLKFNGLYNEDDPLIGTHGSSEANFERTFTLQDEILRRKICKFQQFVTVRGGGYFFLPGISALRILSE
jgi:Dyp-type peroxidase family